MVNTELILINEESIKDKILVIRGIPVMLDRDLALIYGYSVKALNQQVKNNIEKFPSDMMFKLIEEEFYDVLRSNFLTANISSMSRSLPYAFTEQGIYMLMTVLKGDLATKQSICLVRQFKAMREELYNTQRIQRNGENYLLIKCEKRIDTLEENMATKDDIYFLTNKMNRIESKFKEEDNLKNFIFLKDTRYEADEIFRKLFSSSKSSLIIIDNYISTKNLYLLKDVKIGLKISIFTSKKKLIKDKLNEIEYKDFKKDNKNININLYDTKEIIHDRIIIIDYKTKNQKVYTLGSSIKDTGIKISILNELTYFEINEALKDVIENSKPFWIG